MKSLEEVIHSLETESQYEGGGWMLVNEDTYNDAIPYLKMYRSDKAQYEIDRENWNTTYKEAREHYEAARDKHIDAIRELNAKLMKVRDDEQKIAEEIARYQEAVKNCEAAESKYRALEFGYIHAMADLEDNPPLTWEELKQMTDQPIWLEEREMCDDPFTGNWRLINCIEMWKNETDTERMMVTGSELESYAVYHRDMGEYWQAYRKERNEKS